MNVHQLYVALSQQNRKAKVTVEGDKILVGGKPLKVGKDAEPETVEGAKDEGGEAK